MNTHNALPYNPTLRNLARTLRKNQTRAETLLWQELRNRKCSGYKFLRQHIIASYITDFYCHELRLVIEIDGRIHDLETQKEYDAIRTAEFLTYGLTVIRYSNDDILHHLAETLADLKSNIQTISNTLSKLPFSYQREGVGG